jgi:hypothetical protein
MSSKPANRQQRTQVQSKVATKPADIQAYQVQLYYQIFQHQFADTMRVPSPAGVVLGSQHTETKQLTRKEEAGRGPSAVGLPGELATGMD